MLFFYFEWVNCQERENKTAPIGEERNVAKVTGVLPRKKKKHWDCIPLGSVFRKETPNCCSWFTSLSGTMLLAAVWGKSEKRGRRSQASATVREYRPRNGASSRAERKPLLKKASPPFGALGVLRTQPKQTQRWPFHPKRKRRKKGRKRREQTSGRSGPQGSNQRFKIKK